MNYLEEFEFNFWLESVFDQNLFVLQLNSELLEFFFFDKGAKELIKRSIKLSC
jgi:hypothetical protein